MRMKKSELPERLEFARTHSKRAFAERYGVTMNTAHNFYGNHGLKAVKEPKEGFVRLPELLKEKKPAECAVELGITVGSVYRWMKMQGIPTDPAWRKRRGREAGERDAMVAWLAERFSDASIARLLGVSRELIRQIVERQKKESELA